MATAERDRTATGLTVAEIRALRPGEKRALYVWHETVAGDDDGRPWLPGAVRALPLDARLRLAEDLDADVAWRERERRRVRDVHYFIPAYGHLKDEDNPGPAIPFDLWPAQRDVLDLMIDELLLAILKARQLGLTWLALHYAYHLMAIDPAGASAVVLGLSQDGTYAKRLLERTRRINDLMPAFLRHAEDRETQESKTEFKLQGRGRMVSLAGTKDAPRSWQADLAIADEWAFVRNAQAGPTMRALLSAARKIFAISSGNGPPEEPGWGQYFATLYTRAAAGENDWVDVFLPTSTHPRRDEDWRENERLNYDTDEDYLAEHPETDDDALIGAGKDRYFKLSEINASVALGAEYDAMLGTDDMPPPAGELLHTGNDWGEGAAVYPIWPLEGGGVYVPPIEGDYEVDVDGERLTVSLPAVGQEPAAVAAAAHHALLELQEVDPDTGRLVPPLGEVRYDAAGIQSNRTYMARARTRYTQQYDRHEARARKVPFGKSGGGGKGFKTETAGYMRRLFRRVGSGRSTQVIAISPANVVLIRQLRALESGDGGVWKKAEDQHGPDAIVAGVQRIARVQRELRGE